MQVHYDQGAWFNLLEHFGLWLMVIMNFLWDTGCASPFKPTRRNPIVHRMTLNHLLADLISAGTSYLFLLPSNGDGKTSSNNLDQQLPRRNTTFSQHWFNILEDHRHQGAQWKIYPRR
jgi:hypothetical protein